MKDLLRFFSLPKQNIVEFNFILSGYDGMGVVRTLDPDRGLIEVLLAPGFEKDFNELVARIGAEFDMKEIPKPPESELSIANESG